jgi:hypothetical protein
VRSAAGLAVAYAALPPEERRSFLALAGLGETAGGGGPSASALAAAASLMHQEELRAEVGGVAAQLAELCAHLLPRRVSLEGPEGWQSAPGRSSGAALEEEAEALPSPTQWTCGVCLSSNTGRACESCGTPRPTDAVAASAKATVDRAVSSGAEQRAEPPSPIAVATGSDPRLVAAPAGGAAQGAQRSPAMPTRDYLTTSSDVAHGPPLPPPRLPEPAASAAALAVSFRATLASAPPSAAVDRAGLAVPAGAGFLAGLAESRARSPDSEESSGSHRAAAEGLREAAATVRAVMAS